MILYLVAQQIEALSDRVYTLENKVGDRGLEAMERNVEKLILERETERLAALADKPRQCVARLHL